MENSETQAYQSLGPEHILDAVESQGYVCDGRLAALNSYENRVYQIGLERGDGLVAKFYRPQRWSDEAIAEEHVFAAELADAEVPVVAPIRNEHGESLFKHGSYRFALFPQRGGRAPELDNPDHLEQMGRFIGRIHLIGRTRRFEHRPDLTVESFGEDSYRFLLEHGFIPPELELAYRSLAEDLITRVRYCYERAGDVPPIRVHGDCHVGNVLWTTTGPHFVDLDDSRNAPAAQDLWMLLSGDRPDRTAGLHDALEGYTQFCEFDPRQLHLFEALCTLRLMYYYAWLARRWRDPAFPRAFPWFNTQKCWEEHILNLREQAAAMDEEPLQWLGNA